jgi:hypothetical protein
VPSKKQRRRRAKAFRQEYDLVLVDAEGNEIPVAARRCAFCTAVVAAS